VEQLDLFTLVSRGSAESAEPAERRDVFQQPVPSPPAPASSPQPPAPVFVRHRRARRYVVRVRHDGSVRVTIPNRGSRREAEAFLDRQRSWVDKQRQRIERERLDGAPLPAADETGTLRARAKVELPPRLLELAAQHGLSVSRVSVRNQQWRWGSCSRSGHICLNWRLVTMPAWVRDYVLIHELMHLKRMDHSPKFWALVAAACPNYEDARAWLRKSRA